MTTVRITPVTIGEEVHLIVLLEGATDQVGPLQEGQELLAVLDPPVVAPGRRPPTKAMRRLSDKQERRDARDLGGNTQPGSGNQAGAKGDVRRQGEDRVEAKFTFAQSYTIKREELWKILAEATPGEIPALQFDFRDKDTQRVTDSWVVIHYEDWLKLRKNDAPADDPRASRRRPR